MRELKASKHLKPMLEKNPFNWTSERLDYEIVKLRMRSAKLNQGSMVDLIKDEIKLQQSGEDKEEDKNKD